MDRQRIISPWPQRLLWGVSFLLAAFNLYAGAQHRPLLIFDMLALNGAGAVFAIMCGAWAALHAARRDRA